MPYTGGGGIPRPPPTFWKGPRSSKPGPAAIISWACIDYTKSLDLYDNLNQSLATAPLHESITFMAATARSHITAGLAKINKRKRPGICDAYIFV